MVQRGYRPGGSRAQCKVCKAVFPKPPSSGDSKREADAAKTMADLRKENAKLRKEVQEIPTAAPGPKGPAEQEEHALSIEELEHMLNHHKSKGWPHEHLEKEIS